MVYFTADLHLGHANIIGHCNRPFPSVEEMDRVLLQNWSDRVRPMDTVYILGDCIFRSKAPAADYLEQMPGHKHLIVGNHDAGWMKKTDLGRFFESVSRMTEIHEGGHRLVLCHYPMMTWNNVGHGSYHIYGHIHNNTRDFYWPLLRQMDHALNAGVDINGFRPVTLPELIENNARHRAACDESSL